MKTTLAIVALIGSISAITVRTQDYYPEVATAWNADHPHPGFEITQSGFSGVEGLGAYSREAPSNFKGPDPVATGDDQFMNSMIMKYSLELTTPEGQKTGKFVFKKVNAKLAAEEVLETHMGLKGKEEEDYMKKNFEKVFTNLDAAGQGYIEVERMQEFMRQLSGIRMIDL